MEWELRRSLVRFGRMLYRLGFMPGTSGNLSVRLDEERILATPTGRSKFLLRSEDMVIVDLDGRQLAGTRKVTSEIGMHLAIYRLRPDADAVIHSHPPIATGFACSGRPLDEPLCSEAIMTLGVVPLAPYATTGTHGLVESLEPLIPHHSAILLANHGAVTCGNDLLDAFLKMETVEHFAHICLVAHQLGSVRLLEGHAIDQLHEARARYLAGAHQGGRMVRQMVAG
ncbi:class II aldolase/adducin family protein [Edaphobacter sp. 4G125]|nr:class II aldolase/adducin family protein [Edaphobacter sp. 4G125]